MQQNVKHVTKNTIQKHTMIGGVQFNKQYKAWQELKV
jgi:hypothetical protein